MIIINTQPASITNVTAGNINSNLTVLANISSGTSLSYQWYSNETNNNKNGIAIDGEVYSSFNIPTSLTSGTYYYYVEVSANTYEESVCSNVATVVVWTPSSLPCVYIIATGGTIAGSGNGNLNVDQLISAVPMISQYAVINAEQIANIGSSNMTLNILIRMANRINELLSTDDVDGIVITHGTDTMEESAYFLNLVIKSEKPVVLTGSMRISNSISADGPLNLLQAVQVAGSKEATGRGVMVVLNGTINSAREVTKISTSQVEAFSSLDIGILGYIKNNRPVFYQKTTRKHTVETEFDISNIKTLPRIEIVYCYLDANIESLNSIIAGKPAGIIVAGVGDGNISSQYSRVLTTAAQNGIVVVRSSRVGSGIVTIRSSDAFIEADNLNPQKARILLMLALTVTTSVNKIQNMFNIY